MTATWTRKSMAPFRADLQADLDARKAALAEPVAAPATETNAADDLIARVEACAVIADVLALEESYQKARADMFDVPEQDRIEAAIDVVKAALNGARQ